MKIDKNKRKLEDIEILTQPSVILVFPSTKTEENLRELIKKIKERVDTNNIKIFVLQDLKVVYPEIAKELESDKEELIETITYKINQIDENIVIGILKIQFRDYELDIKENKFKAKKYIDSKGFVEVEGTFTINKNKKYTVINFNIKSNKKEAIEYVKKDLKNLNVFKVD